MSQIAHFRFYGSLNDFLRPKQRNTAFSHTFAAHQSLKDIVEAMGVPNVEVREIWVNGDPANFGGRLSSDDQVAVYPFDGHETELLKSIAVVRFVLDVHLGTLARALRMLGFDTVYRNDLHDPELVQIASAEQRILLTRDVNLLKNKAIPAGYWLRSQHTEEQLTEVIRRFRLLDQIKPFTRCMVCNGCIRAVTKESVLDQLPARTRLYFEEFYQCQNCLRIYWKGSHYARMEELVKRLKQVG
jgi:uncharacterized protein